MGTFDSKEWRECFDVFKNKRWLWIGNDKNGFWAIETKKFCFKIYEAGWKGTYLSGKNLKGKKPEDFLDLFKGLTLKVVINDYYKIFKGSKKFITKWERAYILKKKEEEELLRNYKKSLREDIKRAERNGLVFRKLDKKDIMRFYELYVFTIKKLNSKPLPFGFIKKLYEKLKEKKLSDFYGVFKNRELLSGVVTLYPDEKTSLAFIQGTSETGYKFQASPFLFHNLIIEEFRKGMEIFSFGAVPEGRKSLVFFKRNFRAEEYIYPVYIWHNTWYIEE